MVEKIFDFCVEIFIKLYSAQGPEILIRAPKLLRLGARLAPQKRNLILTPV